MDRVNVEAEERQRKNDFYDKFKYKRVSPSPIRDEVRIRRSREASMRESAGSRDPCFRD